MAKPVYLYTDLKERIKKAYNILEQCHLCPRKCGVNRLEDEKGVCKTGKKAMVSSYNVHFGEEAPLVGKNGSGTIFFTNCNLLCNFCQNYDISHEGHGYEVSDEQLAEMMITLQNKGCHNINFVTPSHVVPQILSALEIAIEKGLSIPLIYNTGGYDNVETLKLLEGIFDIYMPDFKFWDAVIAGKTCNASDYPEVARKVVAEMHRQVGDLKVDENEIAGFIVKEISPNSYVNIMPQYRPCGKASEIEELSNFLYQEEYDDAVRSAKEEGLWRFD
jgi:putative pyruvate formate lyase activating enzyme